MANPKIQKNLAQFVVAESPAYANLMFSQKENDMKFPLLNEIKAGDRLKADSGFTCLHDGQIVTVETDEGGRQHVPCADGRHYLDGQEGEDGGCVGFCRA